MKVIIAACMVLYAACMVLLLAKQPHESAACVRILAPDNIPDEGILWRMPSQAVLERAFARGDQVVIDLTDGPVEVGLVYGKDPDVYLLMSKEARSQQKLQRVGD